MTTATIPNLRKELLAAEQAYFAAVIAREDNVIRALCAPTCMVVGPAGVEIIDREGVAEMVRNHEGEAEYEIAEDTVQVIGIDDNAGAISYRLDTLTPGTSQKSSSFSTTVWTRDGDQWFCAAHITNPAQR